MRTLYKAQSVAQSWGDKNQRHYYFSYLSFTIFIILMWSWAFRTYWEIENIVHGVKHTLKSHLFCKSTSKAHSHWEWLIFSIPVCIYQVLHCISASEKRFTMLLRQGCIIVKLLVIAIFKKQEYIRPNWSCKKYVSLTWFWEISTTHIIKSICVLQRRPTIPITAKADEESIQNTIKRQECADIDH